MLQISTLPIVIISSPRTGSTALAIALKHKLGGELFNEPGNDDLRLNDFLRYSSMKKDYILKEHAGKFLEKYSKFDLTDCTIIRINRKDLVSQAISNYISNKRKKWFYTDNDQHYQNESITYDEPFLRQCFHFTKTQNTMCDNFKGRVDFDLFYEDIITELSTSEKTIRPKNYQELLEWANEIYAKT